MKHALFSLQCFIPLIKINTFHSCFPFLFCFAPFTLHSCIVKERTKGKGNKGMKHYELFVSWFVIHFPSCAFSMVMKWGTNESTHWKRTKEEMNHEPFCAVVFVHFMLSLLYIINEQNNRTKALRRWIT